MTKETRIARALGNVLAAINVNHERAIEKLEIETRNHRMKALKRAEKLHTTAKRLAIGH
jgi:hypothetical protein